MMNREEMLELFRAGERATWPKLPMIETTTRIGRCLDQVLHDFEAREEGWLDNAGARNAGKTTALKNRRARKPGGARGGAAAAG
jgi:NTE family protein